MAENRELALVLRLVADQFTAELKNSQGALGQFNSFIKDWKTQLTAAGTALFAVAKSTANFGEEALKGAQKTGQTVETFSALSYAAKLADVDQQQLIVGLKSLSQNMVEAAQRTGDGEALFRRLGVAATDATGQLRPTEKVLLDLADVFASSADGAGKSEAAVKLFGKAGLDLLPFLNQGKAGIIELMAEAKRLGVVLSTEDARAANAFNDEIKRLESAMRGLTLQLGKELLPTFTTLFEAMGEFASGPGGRVMKMEIQGLAAIFTLLNHGIRETAAELDIFFKKLGASPTVKKFWNDALVEGRKALDAETSKKLHQIFSDSLGEPGGRSSKAGTGVGQESGAGKSQIALGPDLKKLQEDYRLYITGLTSMGQEKLDKEKASYQLYIQGLTSMGQEKLDKDKANLHLYIQGLVLMGEEAKAQRDRERTGLSANAQAWMAYYDQVGGSAEGRYGHEMDLVRANLAQQLDLNVESAGRLVIAWQNKDEELAKMILDRTKLTATERETIELQTLNKIRQAHERVSDDVFAGWARGMQKYVEDTKSGFGLAADMARRTAQTMEQSFKTFFFDLFDGHVKSMKDVLGGLANFVKQVASQIAAQLATSFLIKQFVGGGGGMFTGMDTGWMNNIGEFFGMDFTHKNSGGIIEPRRFSFGGHVLGSGNQDTVRALLTPGEGVLSRRGMATLDQLNAGNLPIGRTGNVTVNIHGAPQDSTASVDVRRTMDGMVLDVILRHQRDLRPLFGGA